jgi:adenylate cyclase
MIGVVDQALAAKPRSAYAHQVKGRLLKLENRWEEAILEYETAITLNRNSPLALHFLAQCKTHTGSIEEAIPLEQQAIRLSPRDPGIGWWYFWIGTVHLLQSRTDEAIVWLERARSSVPAAAPIRARLASSYALKGETERAAAELAEARKLVGNNRFSSLTIVRAAGHWGVPKVRALFEATYFVGLRLAGMPEE